MSLSQSSILSPAVKKARLKWACRRGMLELDVLFTPFVDEAYDDLSEENTIKELAFTKANLQRVKNIDSSKLDEAEAVLNKYL